MNLNIREMIDGNPVRLRYVFRYSTSRVQCPESVAEHSYFVAFYCLMVGRWCIANMPEDYRHDPDGGYPVFMGQLLERAILHDLEEARSGDVPRPFKYSSPELRTMLDTASQRAFQQIVEPITGESVHAGGPAATLFSVWHNAKDETLEGRIVEFADFLSVLSFMMQEGAGNGNRSISRHVADMGAYFRRFLEKDYDFIRPLVDQAEDLMIETFPTYTKEGGYARL